MLKGKGAEIVKASLEKKTRLPWWPSGCDAVFHLRVLSLGRDLGSWMPCSEASINKQSRKSILADLKTYYLTIVIRVVWCWWRYSVQFSSVAQLCPTLRPHGLQHASPPCPSPTPWAHSDPCPPSRWCHPTISSTVITFSSCPQSFPASRSFPMSQFFASSGQSIGVSSSASVLPVNIQETKEENRELRNTST